jgi:hypothetical protein
MRAVTWQGKRTVSVEEVPNPTLLEPTDAIIKVTSTAICGSDLHLYEVMAPFMEKGDILGHESMGIVQEVGRDVKSVKPGNYPNEGEITRRMTQANVFHAADSAEEAKISLQLIDKYNPEFWFKVDE